MWEKQNILRLKQWKEQVLMELLPIISQKEMDILQ